MAPTKIWLDADPGIDDAFLILFALHLPELQLLGISCVHGNNGTRQTSLNAARLLVSFGTPEQAKTIPIFAGALEPLVKKRPKAKGSVHGTEGLGGVEHLVQKEDERVQSLFQAALKGNFMLGLKAALEGLAEGEKLTLIASGPYTNVALFLTAFPELAKAKISSIVAMGGAEGRGNITPVAEANVYNDPEAAKIVFDFNLPVVIAPLTMTHTAIFTHSIHTALLDPSATVNADSLPKPITRLRAAMSENLLFYAESYRSRYGFLTGPPCHDPHCGAYIAHPELYKGKRYRVDVELAGTHTSGATVIDLWGYKDPVLDLSEDNWGHDGRNVIVLEQVDAKGFWDLFLGAIDTADKVCPIGVNA